MDVLDLEKRAGCEDMDDTEKWMEVVLVIMDSVMEEYKKAELKHEEQNLEKKEGGLMVWRKRS